MSSTTAWPLSEIEVSSADLVEPVRRRLTWLVEHPREHARFLNTLSLMEHIGSRKIMASQTHGPLGRDVLKHLAEETRHAFFFKKAAESLARRPLEYGEQETIRPTSARIVFRPPRCDHRRQARSRNARRGSLPLRLAHRGTASDLDVSPLPLCTGRAAARVVA